MKNIYRLLVVPILCLGSAHAQQNPFEVVKPKNESFQVVSFSDVKPTGWLLEQINDNLAGFTGNLDQLLPDLIVNDDIYGKDRLTRNSKSKELGALGDGNDFQIQLYWWNSETQSNWWDGYIRSAILSGDKKHLDKIRVYVNNILAGQDADGYLGIYDQGMRYKFDNENGELWAKASLLRGLLAWYEYSDDKKVLSAIERAVQNTIKHYPAGKTHPFYTTNPNVGGLSHGLTFTDVLEQLFYITNNKTYRDYSLFLYEDFSKQTMNEDAQYAKLMDRERMLTGHGVHTYEHLRSLAAAWYASGNPQLHAALDNFEQKIALTTTATGGPVGDEWIAGRKADATTRGYEYCSLQELLHSYASLFAKTGTSSYGDKIEKLFFNAAQGARHPEESCIAYLKSDNSYYMTGGLNGDTSDEKQTRFRYSPAHREAAVCCVPNAGRIAPYYTQYMWLKSKEAIVASLLGPSVIDTEIKGKKVRITEKTGYPYENTVTFDIEANGASFDLMIRKPEWVSKFSLNVPYKETDGFLVISKKWQKGDSVVLQLMPEPIANRDLNGEIYYSYGALVLAHPIRAGELRKERYPVPGFADLEYKPTDLVVYKYASDKIERLESGAFRITAANPLNGRTQQLELQPLAKTILRQTTFKAN